MPLSLTNASLLDMLTSENPRKKKDSIAVVNMLLAIIMAFWNACRILLAAEAYFHEGRISFLELFVLTGLIVFILYIICMAPFVYLANSYSNDAPLY